MKRSADCTGDSHIADTTMGVACIPNELIQNHWILDLK